MGEKNIFRQRRGPSDCGCPISGLHIGQLVWAQLDILTNGREARHLQRTYITSWQQQEQWHATHWAVFGLKPKLGSHSVWQDPMSPRSSLMRVATTRPAHLAKRVELRFSTLRPPNDARFSSSHIALMANCPLEPGRLSLAQSIKSINGIGVGVYCNWPTAN